jgi:hypothetical protein
LSNCGWIRFALADFGGELFNERPMTLTGLTWTGA